MGKRAQRDVGRCALEYGHVREVSFPCHQRSPIRLVGAQSASSRERRVSSSKPSGSTAPGSSSGAASGRRRWSCRVSWAASRSAPPWSQSIGTRIRQFLGAYAAAELTVAGLRHLHYLHSSRAHQRPRRTSSTPGRTRLTSSEHRSLRRRLLHPLDSGHRDGRDAAAARRRTDECGPRLRRLRLGGRTAGTPSARWPARSVPNCSSCRGLASAEPRGLPLRSAWQRALGAGGWGLDPSSRLRRRLPVGACRADPSAAASAEAEARAASEGGRYGAPRLIVPRPAPRCLAWKSSGSGS